MHVHDVEKAVCAVLYLDPDDLEQGTETDLRDLGFDSLRLVLLLNRLGIEQSPAVFERIAARPTIATIFEVASSATSGES